MQKRTLGLALILLAVTIASPYAQAQKAPPPPPAAAAAKNVSVTVNYTGKGPVDAGHAILVFLLPDPNVGPASRPIGPPQVIQKNGATATFKEVAVAPVYVVAVYNEKGNYDGSGGPPPAGTPYAVYAKDARSPAIAVTPGPKTTVKMTISDARRWGQ